MDAAVTVEVVYIMIELDGKQRVELDKLNNVYKVNGVDLLAKNQKAVLIKEDEQDGKRSKENRGSSRGIGQRRRSDRERVYGSF